MDIISSISFFNFVKEYGKFVKYTPKLDYILLAILFAFFTAAVAKYKGYSLIGWFLLGFLFGPIALIASVGLPKRKILRWEDAPEKPPAEKEVIKKQDTATLEPKPIPQPTPQSIPKKIETIPPKPNDDDAPFVIVEKIENFPMESSKTKTPQDIIDMLKKNQST